MQRNGSAPAPTPESAAVTGYDKRVAWTVREASARLGLPTPTVYAYVKSGLLPAIKLGGRLLIPAAAVLALVDEAMDQWDGPDAR
jgi:excisionase family DNA binding protein